MSRVPGIYNSTRDVAIGQLRRTYDILDGTEQIQQLVFGSAISGMVIE